MLYNHLLVDRIQAYTDRGESLTFYGQKATLPMLKQQRTTLAQVHSQVLQDVVVRVDLAFKAFFRRCKPGGTKPGFPRFKGLGRYDSLTYPQTPGFRLRDWGCNLSRVNRQEAQVFRLGSNH